MKNLLDHDAVWVKNAAESIFKAFEIEDLETGETITSATVVAIPAVAGELTVTTPGTVSGSEVSTLLSGGLAGHEYTVRFTITTSTQPAVIKDALVKVIP